MSPAPDPPRSHAAAVRHVQLPSGRTIEIVYFDGTKDQPAAAGASLHVCPGCRSALVHPMAWEEALEDGWALTLRCPECYLETEGVFSQAAVEQLDEQLDHGTRILVHDLKQLQRANLEEEVERFCRAMAGGHIWPLDF